MLNLRKRLADWGWQYTMKRPADLDIGGREDPYLRRWFIVPRNRWFNIYLHLVLRDDDDRALHDHPWWNCSIVLDGGYLEQTIAAGGIIKRVWRLAGSVVVRRPKAAHRLVVGQGLALTLFITGPRVREWGFHCPEQGWVHWRAFTGGENGELIGAGCDGAPEGPL